MAGTAKRQTRPPADARPLEDMVLQDWRGSQVRLGDMWAEGPAVLVFLRHYG